MNMYELTVVIHVVGAAIGVGAATSSDWLFLHSIRDRVITSQQYTFLDKVSHVVMAGLVVVVLSGVAIVLQNPDVFAYPSFLAKMIFIFCLIVNGFVFHAVLMGFLKKHRNQRLTDEMLANRMWVFAAAGAVSIVSWYGALLIGAIDTIALSVGVLLLLYVVAIAGAAGFAYLLLSHLLFSPIIEFDAPDVLAEGGEELKKLPISWSNALLGVLLAIFVGGLAWAFFAN